MRAPRVAPRHVASFARPFRKHEEVRKLMTMPDERTRAVLWAGGLLVQLNGDRRVPMEICQAATHIARHFPTRNDVAGASRLKLLGEYGSLFAHPRDCAGWEDSCPMRPLAEGNRLRWPTKEIGTVSMAMVIPSARIWSPLLIRGGAPALQALGTNRYQRSFHTPPRARRAPFQAPPVQSGAGGHRRA